MRAHGLVSSGRTAGLRLRKQSIKGRPGPERMTPVSIRKIWSDLSGLTDVRPLRADQARAICHAAFPVAPAIPDCHCERSIHTICR